MKFKVSYTPTDIELVNSDYYDMRQGFVLFLNEDNSIPVLALQCSAIISIEPVDE